MIQVPYRSAPAFDKNHQFKAQLPDNRRYRRLKARAERKGERHIQITMKMR